MSHWRWALVGAIASTLACGGHAGTHDRATPGTLVPAVSTEPTREVSRATAVAFDYPMTRREDVVDVLHGVPVPDPYRWLEGDGPEVSAWTSAQDRRARSRIAALKDAETRWNDIVRIRKSIQAPLETRRGRKSFYRSKESLFVREEEKPEEVLFDSATLPEGTRVTDYAVSRDGSLVALELSKSGADMRTLRVLDVTKRRLLDEIGGIEGSEIVWTERGFFYAYTPPDVPHAMRWSERTIRFHRAGDTQDKDREIVPASHDKDASSGMNPLGRTTDGKWLLARTFGNWSRQSFALVDLRRSKSMHELNAASGAVTSACVVDSSVFAAVKKADGTFDIVQVVEPNKPWRTVGHVDATFLRMSAEGAYLVLKLARGATTRYEFFDAAAQRVAVRETAVGTTETIAADPGSLTVTILREGLRLPPERLVFDPRSNRETRIAAAPVEFDADALTIESFDVASKDGTRIPITVLRRNDLVRDGNAPLWTYGYGGFAVSAEQVFFAPWTAWVIRGGVFAICHTRGGLEFGEPWHEAGARENRQHGFDDFTACIEELHRRSYSSPARTMTQGWSHGGMFVSAVAMQHPELQRVVLATVPLEDMVRFPLFGRGSVSEYGDPDVEGDFKNLFSFSPYHHVKDGTRYPAFLITASSNDERVAPIHARKFAAALQHASTGGEVLLKVNWGAGHHGGGQEDATRVFAEAAAFAYREFGL